jgi:hypothetical protein
MAASGRMQYDYKQTNAILHYQKLGLIEVNRVRIASRFT